MNSLIISPEAIISENPLVAKITGRQFDHCKTFLKCKIGDSLKIGLLNKNLGIGTILSFENDSIIIQCNLVDNPPQELPCTLIVALPRPKSLKKVIEVSVVMGVKKIFLIESWKVDKSYWNTPWLCETSLRELSLLALEQSVDTVLPDIQIRRRFKPFVEDELPAITNGSKPLLAHPYGAKACPYNVDHKVTLVIGPEGGFTPYEVDKFKSIGFEAVTTGPRILRVEHAVNAFLSRLF